LCPLDSQRGLVLIEEWMIFCMQLYGCYTHIIELSSRHFTFLFYILCRVIYQKQWYTIQFFKSLKLFPLKTWFWHLKHFLLFLNRTNKMKLLKSSFYSTSKIPSNKYFNEVWSSRSITSFLNIEWPIEIFFTLQRSMYTLIYFCPKFFWIFEHKLYLI